MSRRRWVARTIGAVAGCAVLTGLTGCSAWPFGPERSSADDELVSPTPVPAGTLVVTAVGDISPEGDSDKPKGTARAAAAGQVILGLGDYQYGEGDMADYNRWFDRSWGPNVPKMYPVLAPNHDQYWRAGSDPLAYFNGGGRSGVKTPVELAPHTSYSFDRDGWHFMAIDDSCYRDLDNCDPAELVRWVREDLAASDAPCTIAYWHQPFWTSTTKNHKPFRDMQAVVEELDDARVDLVLGAHQHGYERFHPQRADGKRDDQRGMRAFVVGTGGVDFYDYTSEAENSATQQDSAHGVLRLELREGEYSWEFVRTSGEDYEDSGSGSCV